MVTRIKIPQKIQIAAFNYSIELRKHLMADKHNAGFFNPVAETLSIDPHLPPTERKISLAHEVLHLIERAFEISIDDADTERLAMGFVCFLDNLGIELDWSDIKELSA